MIHRTAAAAVLSVLVVAATAHAQTWRPITRQCSAQLGEQGGKWPLWAQCTIARAFPHTDPTRVQRCIAQVTKIRERTHACNLCGDPVRSVIDCATEGQQ
jgi:hypothetical protein